MWYRRKPKHEISQISKLYEKEKEWVKSIVAGARQVVIGLDIWTKIGMTASFLAISATFFCPANKKPKHFLSSLIQIGHAHTGDTIKNYIDNCLALWDIPPDKVLTVITDNGSNMIAAFRSITGEDAESQPS